MAVGTRFEYRLRLKGLPIRWESEITAWEPPDRFIDEQKRGPYHALLVAPDLQRIFNYRREKLATILG